MIYNLFYFKFAINLIDYFRAVCRKKKTWPLNVTFLCKFLYKIAIKSVKRTFLRKIQQEKRSKDLILPKFQTNLGKTICTERMKAH